MRASHKTAGLTREATIYFFLSLLGPDLAQEGVQDTPDVIREQLLVVDPGSDLHIGPAQHDKPMQRQSMRSELTSEQGWKIDESQIATGQLDALSVISELKNVQLKSTPALSDHERVPTLIFQAIICYRHVTGHRLSDSGHEPLHDGESNDNASLATACHTSLNTARAPLILLTFVVA